MTRPPRTQASIAAELNQLREALENAHHRNRRLEASLRELLRGTGLEPVSIEVFDLYGCAPRATQTPAPRRVPPPESIWPSARADTRALRPTPGLAGLTLADQALAAVGISVCGFSTHQVSRIVEAIGAKQTADRNFVPVFLTDCVEPEVFRNHRYVFEYFPMRPDMRQLAGTRSWEAYALDRLALLRRKYALTQIITFGRLEFAVGTPPATG